MSDDDPAALLDERSRGDNGEPLPPAAAGIVTRVPADPADDLGVTVPGFDDDARSTSFSCPWMPRVDAAGAYVAPSPGDRCLVIFDDANAPWVVAYQPT